MIKVTINNLLNSVEALQKLSKMDFKAKLAWQVARLLKAAEQEIQSFNETRLALIGKYGEKDENGQLVTDEKGNCKIEPENINKFSEELSELINSEVELNVGQLDFAQMENLTFTPSEMDSLTPFINFEE